LIVPQCKLFDQLRNLPKIVGMCSRDFDQLRVFRGKRDRQPSDLHHRDVVEMIPDKADFCRIEALARAQLPKMPILGPQIDALLALSRENPVAHDETIRKIKVHS